MFRGSIVGAAVIIPEVNANVALFVGLDVG